MNPLKKIRKKAKKSRGGRDFTHPPRRKLPNNSIFCCSGGACPSLRRTADQPRPLLKWYALPNCHCEAPTGPWQSREGSYVFAGAFLLSNRVLRDCTPRALPRAARSGRHVGLRPPRNDKSGAFASLTAACTDCKCAAGRGMPLPYNAAGSGAVSAGHPTADRQNSYSGRRARSVSRTVSASCGVYSSSPSGNSRIIDTLRRL